MKNIRFVGAVSAAFALLAMAPTLAADKMMGGHMATAPAMVNTSMNSRFGGRGVYTGAPALGATLAVVMAGGGPKDFKTTTLLQVLAGDAFKPEVAKLTKTYGAAAVGQFIKSFDFVIADSLHYVTVKHIALPSAPAVDPKNGEALAGALWGASSIGGGKHNVEVGLDHLVSHPLHLQVMKDLDAKYGVAADASYHVILTTAMSDLAKAYHLDNNGKMKSAM
ncbi:MAG: hypothetical protein M3N19_01725 [Candidatus Eremiobacteraeota bacterium]|nr:hypothetical protein [Candidatus Eremiobacteraeota bacterium]